MRWSAARTRPALVAGHRRLAGTFELHGSEGYSDGCQLLSRQRVFAVPHAIREDVEGEGWALGLGPLSPRPSSAATPRRAGRAPNVEPSLSARGVERAQPGGATEE